MSKLSRRERRQGLTPQGLNRPDVRETVNAAIQAGRTAAEQGCSEADLHSTLDAMLQSLDSELPPGDAPHSAEAPPAPRHGGGPATDLGKARSAQNSFKHGLAAPFHSFRFLPGEDPAEFADLNAEMRVQFNPQTPCERLKIQDMAQAWWLQHRARDLQTRSIENNDEKAFALYLRYETSERRAYQMAHRDFQEMKKARLENEASLSQPLVSSTFQSERTYPTPPPPEPAPVNHPTAPPADPPLAA